MSPTNFNDKLYSLCDTAESVKRAVQLLSAASYLAFDCEGENLGEEGGRLAILSLAATDTSPLHVYLFDAVALSNDELAPVFDLLTSTEHTKVMFDARMDFSELLHHHSVRLSGVLDLQLADIESRARRGEGVANQLERLSPYLRRNDVAKDRAGYATIHRLNGLGFCMKEHGIVDNIDDAKPADFTHTRWTVRPLSVAYQLYAAGDVRLIAALYAKFKYRSYIDEDNLLEQSTRYMAIYEGGMKKPGGGHPLLPLGILSVPASIVGKRTCTGCRRALALVSFSSRSSDKCWMCHALDVRAAGYRPPRYTARRAVVDDDALVGMLRGVTLR